MSGVKIEILGIEEIKKALAELSKGIGDRALQDINREAAKIAKKALQQSAPAQRLKKAKSISLRPIRGGKNRTSIDVGYNKAGYLARFYERGATNRKTKKGYNRGTFQKKPFVKSTFESVVPQILDFVSKNALRIMKRSLDKYSGRLNKRLGK